MLLYVKMTVYPLTIAAGPAYDVNRIVTALGRETPGYRDRVLDAGRRDHGVLFYRDEAELTDRVSEYLVPAIQGGGVAIVVATPDHRRSFERHLAGAGVDVAAACARGAYLAPDASETLRGFMAAGCPDPAGFWQVISPLLRQAAQAGQPARLRRDGRAALGCRLIDAAIELEALWNELGVQYPFSLLCAYPAQPAACARQLDALTEVCRAHTQVTGAPPGAE